MNAFLLLLILFPAASFAEESSTQTDDLRLDTIVVNGNASFESLSEESYVPVKSVPFQQVRTGTLDSINKREIFPTVNYGYPSGASGVSLGGRTIDDTQVFTLGVPLNLPQGGGADFSFFPAYLWSEALISPTLSSAGFSPQAASGSIQLKPWTRESLLHSTPNRTSSRATVAYDRNLQTYSLGTQTGNLAVLAGMSTGLQTGPAAELSYALSREPGHHVMFHFIGSSQEGDSPGSKSFPTPNSKKKTWRLIPVIESHQQINSDWTIENTFYADLQHLQFIDPSFPSVTRTQQYGLENAIIYRNYTLALSGRYINYVTKTQSNHEWPLLSTLAGEYALTSKMTLKLIGGGNYLDTAGGFYPIARATIRYEIDAQQYFFAEGNTIPKLPTMVARFYPASAFYTGNPNLKAERVNAILAGHQFENAGFQNTITAKGEYRTDVQIDQNQTTQNAGKATLMSLKEDLKYKAFEFLEFNASTLLTYSQLKNRTEPYPNLPFFNQLIGVRFIQGDLGDLNVIGRYTGASRAPDPNAFTSPAPFIHHSDFFLFDTWVNYNVTKDLTLTAGIDNLFDNRAEVILDYPLPGRMIYLSAQARF